MLDPTPDASIAIDLDRARQPVAPGRWARFRSRRLPMGLVVVLVLGGVLAGMAGMGLWAARQWVRTQSALVSVFATVAGINSAYGESGGVVIEGTVAVMNGGPLPVHITGVGEDAALVLQGSQRIIPHATAWFPVRATVSCVDSTAPVSMTAELVVIPSDGRRHLTAVVLPLTGTAWSDPLARACHANLPG
ncbi:hypothetical protein AB0M47_01390 [Hamadaea sp. NPDC051192]|uniref:hypothetical protein n=1 Tax=Hamadaea sp. NPDC051192 TaxID=3154940 RepID=UPI0034315430